MHSSSTRHGQPDSCRPCCRRVNFAGTDPGVVFNNLLASARPHLRRDRRREDERSTANYAICWGQVGSVAGVASQVNPLTTRDRALSVGRCQSRRHSSNRTKSPSRMAAIRRTSCAETWRTGIRPIAGFADDSEHGRSESEERPDRRVDRRIRSRNRCRIRGGRQLRLAPLPTGSLIQLLRHVEPQSRRRIGPTNRPAMMRPDQPGPAHRVRR